MLSPTPLVKFVFLSVSLCTFISTRTCRFVLTVGYIYLVAVFALSVLLFLFLTCNHCVISVPNERNSHHLHSSRQDNVQNSTSQNPYKLKEAKEIFAKEDRTINNKIMHSTSLDEEIIRVTKLFCDWVSSLVSLQYSKQTCTHNRIYLHSHYH